MVSFGLGYAAVVRDDHRHFAEAFREGRIPGVTATQPDAKPRKRLRNGTNRRTMSGGGSTHLNSGGLVMADYNFVRSISQAEFDQAKPSQADLDDPTKTTKSDYDDIAKMERLLDLKDGALAGDQYYLERLECVQCGRLLTMYDFVFTGLVDAGHPKSLIVHTFLGNKLVLNDARPIRCSACGQVQPPRQTLLFDDDPTHHSGPWYYMEGYGCRPSAIEKTLGADF
jgi:hypothetical protein